MKVLFSIFFFLIIALNGSFAQSRSKIKPSGNNQSVSLGFAIPVGDFLKTHIAGASVDYSFSNHRFGLLEKIPEKLLGLMADVGAEYYVGKHDKINPTGYHYPGFVYVHGYAGAILNASPNVNIILSAGPALGLYNNFTQFWWGINCRGNYYINKKIAIGPGIMLMKQSIADPLVSLTIKAMLVF